MGTSPRAPARRRTRAPLIVVLGVFLGSILASHPLQSQKPSLTALHTRPELKFLSPARLQELDELVRSSSIPAQLAVNGRTGAVEHMRGKFAISDRTTAPEEVARRFLVRYEKALNLPANFAGEISTTREIGTMRRVRTQQVYEGLPVFGVGYDLDISPEGEVIGVCGNSVNLGSLNTSPNVSAGEAAATVRRQIGISEQVRLVPQLGILDRGTLLRSTAKPKLAWRVPIEVPDGQQESYVDAQDGSLAFTVTIPGSLSSSGLPCTDNVVPQFHVNSATGVPDFISFAPLGLWLPESATGSPDKVALALFTRFPLLFGTADVPNQLRVISVQRSAQAPHMTHVRLQQMYGGVPVFGAELRVHLKPGLVVSSVSGNYVRDPQVPLEPKIAEATARETAVSSMVNPRSRPVVTKKLPDVRDLPRTLKTIPESLGKLVPGQQATRVKADLQSQVQSKGLQVLPLKLSQRDRASNALTYWYQFPEANVFVDAVSGKVAYAFSTRRYADRLVYDARGRDLLAVPGPDLVFQNGQPVSQPPSPLGNPAPPHADAVAADPLLVNTLSFYENLGRRSYDDHDSAARVVANANLEPSVSCPNAFWDPFRNQMMFCAGELQDDVLVHEFTHGVTQYTAGLIYLDEPGALSEHFSDMMAAVATQNSAGGPWVHGENAPGACRRPSNSNNPLNVRHLADPAMSCSAQTSNYAQFRSRASGCTGPLDPLNNSNCDNGHVHTNSGIGNIAGALLADGRAGTNHAGIGRDRLGRIFFETLTTRLNPWATYMDERLNSWEVVHDLAHSGAGANPSFSDAHADEVSWAFTEVGVDPRLVSGWFVVGGGLMGDKATQTFYQGQHLPAGFDVNDVELELSARGPEGETYWEGRSRVQCVGQPTDSCVPGGRVVFPGTSGAPTIFGAEITSHGIGTNNMETEVRYFHSGYLPVRMRVNIIPRNQQGQPSALPTRQEHVDGPWSHGSIFEPSGRDDDTQNSGVTVTGAADCVVDDVKVEVLDGNGRVVASASRGEPDARGSATFPEWGARIKSDHKGTNNMEVVVHWWHDLGSSIRYQLRYYFLSASGGSCQAP